MERSLSGMLFLVAGVALAIAAGAWWMQRIVFTPDEARDTAAAILDERDIRNELNQVITGQSFTTLRTSQAELGQFLEEQILSTRAGGAVMAPVVRQAHDRIIGLRDEDPITISGDDLIPIVRDQRAAEIESFPLPVEPIGVLKTMRSVLSWTMIIAGGIGALALLLGLVTRPDRKDILRGLGEFGVALAVSMIVFGYLIPVQFLPALDNRIWMHAISQLALRTVPVVIGATVIFAAGGVALIFASRSGGTRRQWSTPLSVARYRSEEGGWS